MPNDDPWDWDVERVVQELCTASRSWTPRSSTAATPNALGLAEKLRHHEIDGPVLLVDIHDAELKEDLGLDRLAHKSFVRHAISELRLKSLQYSTYMERHLPSCIPVSAENLQRSMYGLEQQVRSLHGSISGIPAAFGNTSYKISDQPVGGSSDTGEPSSKRARVESSGTSEETVEASLNDQTLKRVDEAGNAVVLPSDISPSNPEKKRKRIAPTLLTTEIDLNRNREIPTAADQVVLNRIPSSEPSAEPGVIFIDGEGKKRIIPVVQSPPLSNEIPIYTDAFAQPHLDRRLESDMSTTIISDLAKANIGYLGKKAVPVDRLFYSVLPGENIDLGKDDDKNFTKVKQEVPPGLRVYTNEMMKQFLRSEVKSFRRGDQAYLAVQPYPQRLIPKFKQASITLYSERNGKFTVSRQLASQWPEVYASETEHINDAVHLNSFNPLGPDLQMGSTYDDWDVSALEKYRYLEGGDEVLPLYGDSDSDNEYDAATWQEIEDEHQSPVVTQLRESKRPALDLLSVAKAIEQGMTQLATLWVAKRLPKLEKKAWKLWVKCRKSGTKREQIFAAQRDLEHIVARLEKIRNEILLTSWTSKIQVLKQTTSMEHTIFAREDLSWQIATLQKKRPPPKPEVVDRTELSQVPNPSTIVELAVADESGDALDVQSEASSDEEGLEEFVIPDETSDVDMGEEEELAVLPADSEDDDIVLAEPSSASSSPAPEPHVREQLTPRKLVRHASPGANLAVKYEKGSPVVKNATLPVQPPDRSIASEIIVIDLISSDDATPRKSTSQKTTLTSYSTPQKPLFIHDAVVNLDTPPQDKYVVQKLATPVSRYTRPQYDSDDDEEPISSHRRRPAQIISEEEVLDEELLEEEIPHKKKKKFVEDADARGMRDRDQMRRAEQEERRTRLYAKLSQLAPGDEEHGRIIVNDAAKDDAYLYLNEHIAQRIKPHQIDGIRFLWASTITESNEKELQGCLLAHTMGLGKTMQAISLLVTIAEASASENPLISSQIPERLQTSRTLVLCPPTLINNWLDELLTWVKPTNLLGDFWKIDASMGFSNRLRTISQWYEDGGVLVLGYEMFRTYVLNKPTTKSPAPLNEQQHARIIKQLVEGPNIVIADEAHKMKSSRTGLSQAAVQFSTKCRIALTGSPLANNIAEYHTMIDWVAPNYLGPAKEFRIKFVDPIQSGLYGDSKPAEKRQALKMLGVLEMDIGPKVQRQDMSVLKHDLPQKTEFTLTVALTGLQREAYIRYVRSMTGSSTALLTKDGDIKTSTLWSWLGVLTLLCNHPSPFMEKLRERMADVVKNSATKAQESTEGDDTPEDGALFDVNAKLRADVSQDLIEMEMELFDSIDNLEDLHYSNKVKILCQILDAATAVGDKTLVFSQSIPTLNYIERLCRKQKRRYYRLDGETKMNERQAQTKSFNDEENLTDVFLISTMAGGLGLNLQAANRVVIFDFKFNPISEEQAIGRAYRIGQKKETFVYRFIAGGTFEAMVHNKTIFKQQLASRVVDKKSIRAMAIKKTSDFLFEPKDVKQEDLSEFEAVDPFVLDKILESQEEDSTIRAIVQSDIFEKDDDEKLTVEEIAEVERWYREEKGRRQYGKDYVPEVGARTRTPYQSATLQKFASTFESSTFHKTQEMSFNTDGARPRSSTYSMVMPPPNKDARAAVSTPSPSVPQRGLSPILGSNVHISIPRPSSKTVLESNSVRDRVTENMSKGHETPTRGSIHMPPPNSSASASNSVRSESCSQDNSTVHVQGGPSKIKVTAPVSTTSTPREQSRQKQKAKNSSHQGANNVTYSSQDASTPPSSIEERRKSKLARAEPGRTGNNEENKERSDMYKAMNRKPQPVQSLKTPVINKISKKHHRRHGADKDLDHQHRNSGVPGSIQKESSSSKSSATLLPLWAKKQLADKANGSTHRGSNASTSTPSSTESPKNRPRP